MPSSPVTSAQDGGSLLLEPAAGAGYTRLLAHPAAHPVRTVAGIALGIVTFLLSASLVTQGLVAAFWALAGSPGDYPGYYRAMVGYQDPLGMVAVHLGLAVLIPISLGLVLLVHHVRPRWLLSVVGRLRWGYLFACAGIAVVSVVGLWALSRLDDSWVVKPQAGFGGFLLAILLTSPLQAMAEEFFFRGYLMQALGSLVRAPWFAVVASAAVFAVFHGTQNLPLFLGRFGFGVLAGLLVVRTGGLEAAIAVHVVNNVAAFVLAGLFGTIAETKAVQQVGWFEAAWDVGSFAAYAVLAGALAAWMGLANRSAEVASV